MWEHLGPAVGGYEKSLPLGVTRASGLCPSQDEGWWRGTGGVGRGGGRLELETPKGPKGPFLPTSTSPEAGLSPSPPCTSRVCCPGAGDGQEVATGPCNEPSPFSARNPKQRAAPEGTAPKTGSWMLPAEGCSQVCPLLGFLPRALPAEPPGQLRRSDNLPGILQLFTQTPFSTFNCAMG